MSQSVVTTPSEDKSPTSHWPQKRHYAGAALMFTLLAIYGSLVPLNYTPIAWDAALQRFAKTHWLTLGIGNRADWVANILLFMPLSYCWAGAVLLWCPSRWKRYVLSLALIASCIALAITIEFTQLAFPPRTVSQNDILAESIGSIVGVLLWNFVGVSFTIWFRHYSSSPNPKQLVHWFLEAYMIGFLIFSVLPLDLTISPAEIAYKYTHGKIHFIPFQNMSWSLLYAYQVIRHIILFIPVGMFVATWHTSRKNHVRSLATSLALGGSCVLGIELAQIFVYSRFTDTTDILWGLIGVGLGAWMMGYFHLKHTSAAIKALFSKSTRSAWCWLVAAAVYALLLFILFCAPLQMSDNLHNIQQRFHGFFYVPFARLYTGSEFNAISEITKKILFFIPLGAMLSGFCSSLSLSKIIAQLIKAFLVLVIAAIATGIEMFQVFMPHHVPDITDTILYAIGGLLGMCLGTRLWRSMQHYTASSH